MVGTALYCRDLSSAVLLMVGFHGYLRTGELLAITVSACSFDWHSMCLVIALPITKSGLRSGAQEMIVIQDRQTLLLCNYLCNRLQPSDFLLRAPAANFRKVFDTIVQWLGLKSHGYRPYSLRRGGATAALQLLQNVDLVCFRGRWGNHKTAKIYLTEGMASLLSLS